MRITNKIMQRNNLSNINTNKVYQDRLSTQMSTQKKINRPSDDPVVAIRSLRLRSNVTEITQYYSKNIPDADSWLAITQDALSKLSDVISNMAAQCTRGTNKPFTSTDRGIVLEQLKLLSDEVYATGDADYAGRYVFTGYRTDTPLSFRTDEERRYSITEQLDKNALDLFTSVNTGKVLEINSANYDTITNQDGNPITEDDISSTDVHRIRLAYNNCSSYNASIEQQTKLKEGLKLFEDYFTPDVVGNFDLSILDSNNLTEDDLKEISDAIEKVLTKAGVPFAMTKSGVTGGGSIGVVPDLNDVENQEFLKNWVEDYKKTQTDAAGDLASPIIEFVDADGKLNRWTGFAGTTTTKAAGQAGDTIVEEGVITLMHSHEMYPTPYEYAAQNPDAIVYVPETGEMLFGENRYQKLMATKDSEATSDVNEAEIRITYEKTKWEKGDLRPEHYFACNADKKDDAGNIVKDKDGNPEVISYNEEYLKVNGARQVIEYDVGFNQSIRINSTADECFKHGIGREVDDIINALQNVQDLEGAQADIKGIMEKLDDGDPKLPGLQKQLDAVEKALSYAKDKEQKMFEGGISAFQKYLDEANLCVTACGSRGSKLDLVKNRTQNQKTTYETLKSENEDIDITEVAIQLTSAELTYDAALMAAGKVMQTSLMNFI